MCTLCRCTFSFCVAHHRKCPSSNNLQLSTSDATKNKLRGLIANKRAVSGGGIIGGGGVMSAPSPMSVPPPAPMSLQAMTSNGLVRMGSNGGGGGMMSGGMVPPSPVAVMSSASPNVGMMTSLESTSESELPLAVLETREFNVQPTSLVFHVNHRRRVSITVRRQIASEIHWVVNS